VRTAQINVLIVILLLGLSAVVHAQSPTALSLEISGGETNPFPILPNQSGSAIEYRVTDGVVDFIVDSRQDALTYDNPLFCFDFADSGTAVSVHGRDANGHVIMDALDLDSVLVYDLVADTVALSPGISVQCFFWSDSAEIPVFGPFGEVADNQRTEQQNADVLFDDAFAAFPELDIRYENPMVDGVVFDTLDGAAASPEDPLSYELVVVNDGQVTADQLSFPEVFPASGAFAASLSEGSWTCDDNSLELELGYDLCPAELVEGTGAGPIRFENLALPPGGKLTFTVLRAVQPGSSGQVHLHAGVVNGPGGNAESAVATAVLDIVGEPDHVAFGQQPTATDPGAIIAPAPEVRVEDINNNLVTTDNDTLIDVRICDESGANCAASVFSRQVSAGSVLLEGITAPETTGSYTLRANPDNLTYTMPAILSDVFTVP